MKYIVSRSSIYNDDEKPIEEAIEGKIHDYWKSTKYNYDYFMKVCRDIIKLPEGNYRGIVKEPRKVWLVEIDDITKFIDKYGQIVIHPKNNEECLYEIEIYDYYRE